MWYSIPTCSDDIRTKYLNISSLFPGYGAKNGVIKADSLHATQCFMCFFLHWDILQNSDTQDFPRWKPNGWTSCSPTVLCISWALYHGEGSITTFLSARGPQTSTPHLALRGSCPGAGMIGENSEPQPPAGDSGYPRPGREAAPRPAEREGSAGGEWPCRASPINSPRRGGGGRSPRSRRRRSRRRRRRCRRSGRGHSQHRGQRPHWAPPHPHHDGGDAPAGRGDLGRPVLRDLAPLRLRRWLLSPSRVGGGRLEGGVRGEGWGSHHSLAAIPQLARLGLRSGEKCGSSSAGRTRARDIPGSAEERREFGGSGDRKRNSFRCRQWVHGWEGATKLHPGAAAGAEEGRLGRLTFCPTFSISSGKEEFSWANSSVLVPSLLSHSSGISLTRQRSRWVRNKQVLNETCPLIWKGGVRGVRSAGEQVLFTSHRSVSWYFSKGLTRKVRNAWILSFCHAWTLSYCNLIQICTDT